MTRPPLRAPTRDEALLLERHPVFAALPPEALLELRQASHLVVLGAGEPLWHQGQAAHAIGLVVAGRCKWIREDSGKEVIVNVSIPGDLLGAIGFRARLHLLRERDLPAPRAHPALALAGGPAGLAAAQPLARRARLHARHRDRTA